MKRLAQITSSLLFIFLIACSTEDITSETTAEQQTPVEVASAQEINLEQKLELSGQAFPSAVIPLFTPTPLTVIEVIGKVGDKVKIGDNILKLDQELVRGQASQAQKAVEELEKGITAAKELQKNVQIGTEQVKKLQQEIQTSINQSRELINSIDNPDEDLQDLPLLGIIQQSLEISLKQAELSQVAGQVSSLPQVNVRDLEMQLDIAKQNVQQAQKAVESTTITSPIAGTISEINVTENQIAPPNTALVTVVDLNPIIATFYVNSYQVAQLKESMTATLTVDGLVEEIKSTIQTVSPTINPQNNLFKVEIAIQNDAKSIKGGMRITALIDLGGIEKATVIPIDSVLYDENSPYVFLAKNGVVARQNVVLGIRSDDVIEVHEGITKDDLVVTRGKERLTDGAEITVRNED
ncbi:efflux RND transporter periplasmic adaptor subunit [Bacillaceae bacterium IKA-2]|nr:efflux RND transporter periplasmic adaptor subunit [Bacillaceae bacterium IKA-2]